MNKIFVGLSIFALAAMADTQVEDISHMNADPDAVVDVKEMVQDHGEEHHEDHDTEVNEHNEEPHEDHPDAHARAEADKENEGDV
jgi:hypothetical protein